MNIKIGKRLLGHLNPEFQALLRKPEPKVEPLPKLEGRDALPPFLKNSWG